MLGTARQQMVVDYLDATDNEIAVDQMLFRMARTTPERLGYFPRVSFWVKKALRHPFISKILSLFSWFIWLCGGAIFFFVYELLKFEWLRKRAKKQDSEEVFLPKGAVLAFSARVCDIVTFERFPQLPTTWLTFPWAPQRSFPKDALELNLMVLVKKRDLWDSFIDAVHATYFLALDSQRSNWVLQSYTAFRWFLVRRVVDRLSGTLVMTEHFDRWAILVDRSVKLACKESIPKRLVLIQHGSLGGLGGCSQVVNFMHLPARLTSVQELYVYSKQEEQVFRTDILSQNGSAYPLSVHYFKPFINLQGSVKSLIPRILFVGHPLCENFQFLVFKALRKLIDIEAFYKPHPKVPMSAEMADVGWKVIENVSQFPRVELLISYPSTLVIEYEVRGINASVHSLDIEPHLLKDFIDQTLKLLIPSTPFVIDSEIYEKNTKF